MKDDKKVIYTAQKIKEMEDELDDLVNVQKPANLEALKLARSQGDLSENADYDAAKKAQGEIEGRIFELKAKLEHAVIANNGSSKSIGITDYVTFKRVADGKEITVQVVSSDESDVLAEPAKISSSSPLGRVLIGKNVSNEQITVEASKPYEIVIVSFKHVK